MQDAATQREYFNLHTNGLGYLSRVRWVNPNGRGRKAEPFLACAISALRGSTDQPDYTYFDLRVSGAEAIGLIERQQEAVKSGRKVCIVFRVADAYPHTYERDVRDSQTGRSTGRKEWTALIKGRLILIHSISVDGEPVYKRETSDWQPTYALQHELPQHPLNDEGRTEQEYLDGAPDSGYQQPGSEMQRNEEPPAPRQQRPAPAQRQDFAPRERYQPHHSAAPAARGNGPSAGYARRPAPHSGAGYQQQRAGHA